MVVKEDIFSKRQRGKEKDEGDERKKKGRYRRCQKIAMKMH